MVEFAFATKFYSTYLVYYFFFSMETGGALWFENLCMSDPFYLLPLLTSTTLYLQVPYSSSYIRLVGRLLFTAALRFRIQTSLRNTKWAT
jgi:hypothetical protein